MQLIQYFFLSNFCLNMFGASLCPSLGEQDRVLPHMVFCTGFAGCGCAELGRKVCALCEIYCSHSAHSSRPSSTQPQPAKPVQNTICGNILSCYPDDGHNDARNMSRKTLNNKRQINCILLLSLSSPYVHDARSQEPK